MNKFLFDGPNKLFICKPGVTSIDVKIDLYSDYKEEILLGDNSKWLQAIRVTGGDPIPGSSLGGTFFLMNGWKIRPQEADHVLVLDGNLYLDSTETGDICVPTLGSYNVMVRQIVSNIINVVATSGSSPSAIATAVWSDPSATTMSSSIDYISGSTTYLSSSMTQLSSSNETVYNSIMTMSSSIDFMSSSVIFLSSSMSEVSASNVQVYNAVIDMSASVSYMSSSFLFLSSSMIEVSSSNTQVYNAIQNMSSSIDYMSGSVTYLSSSMVELSSSNNVVYNAVNDMSSSITQMSSSINKIEKIEKGKWKIESNQMTFYDEDGITIIGRFDLFDENGNPTSVNVFERRPI